VKAAGSQLPNQTVLINTLPLMEAQASSEIENIVTTADDLFRQAQLNERTADPATREALRETFDVPPELEAELLESIAQADRGETISADEVIERLRRIT
jgi:Fic family protein